MYGRLPLNRLASLAAVALIGATVAGRGGAAGDVAAREAFVTNQPADSVSIVDLAAMRVTGEIKLSGKPAGIAFSPDKAFAYVTAPEGQTLFEIDAARRAVTRSVKLGGGPLGIAAHPTRSEVYVADWYAHKIVVVDAKELKPVAEIAVGKSPSGLDVTPDGALLLSADRDSNQVSIIDITARKVVGAVAVGERPFGMTISSDGKRAYTANVGSDDVSVIDVAEGKLIGTVKVGRRPYAVALGGAHGFVTDQYGGTVSVFDAMSLKAVATIEACDHPEGIERSGGMVYVACWGDNILIRIDAGIRTVTGKVQVGDGPRAFGKFLR